ncbi:MAG TPA: prepilin-type N-terminal cleavage/methylation domain-containing protein [Pyrinomonadaceae bacterium]|nr:prepilin-type N-terminal cleavage/methylation domain-containing protein [Pyrinomonadaceae bacterium]
MKNLRRIYKDQAGFNLIELMIVIAIIALLIGVGVPAWQSMVRSGNETAAAQTIQSIRTCQASYAGKNKGKFANFADLVKSGCLDGDKFNAEQPVISGYVFSQKIEEMSGTTPAKYSLNVDPQTGSGTRHFYYDSTLGAVKVTEDNRPATAQDPSF